MAAAGDQAARHQRRRPSCLRPPLPRRDFEIGNQKCFLSPLIGCPFGSLIRVDIGPNGPHLARCAPSTALNHGLFKHHF